MGSATTLENPAGVSGLVILEETFSFLFDPMLFLCDGGCSSAVARCRFGKFSTKFSTMFRELLVDLPTFKPLSMDFGIFGAKETSLQEATKFIVDHGAESKNKWSPGSIFNLMALRINHPDIKYDQPILAPGSFGNICFRGQESDQFVFPIIFSTTPMVSAGVRITTLSEKCGNFRLLAVRPTTQNSS